MWKRGELAAYQLPSGTVIVESPASPATLSPSQKVAIYTRVSFTENRANLESQAERVLSFCIVCGWVVNRIVKECGSGVNDQRPQCLALLADTSFTHIVVEHNDRCSRFGVAYIQTLLATQGRELVIVNQADTSQDDLMQDFAAIITSFTARLYGRRWESRKKQELFAALEVEDAVLEPEA